MGKPTLQRTRPHTHTSGIYFAQYTTKDEKTDFSKSDVSCQTF